MKCTWALAGLSAAVLAVSSVGLTGCDDDKDEGEVQSVVVTNVVDGTVVTNIVAVPDDSQDPAPAGQELDPPAAQEPAALDVTGEWTGTYQEWGQRGSASHMEFDLHQNGRVIAGQYAAGDGPDPLVGNLTGTLHGDLMTLPVVYFRDGHGLKLEFQGQVSANGTAWNGIWWDRLDADNESDGTFACQKSR